MNVSFSNFQETNIEIQKSTYYQWDVTTTVNSNENETINYLFVIWNVNIKKIQQIYLYNQKRMIRNRMKLRLNKKYLLLQIYAQYINNGQSMSNSQYYCLYNNDDPNNVPITIKPKILVFVGAALLFLPSIIEKMSPDIQNLEPLFV
jgi:D-lyxose ketol-isomerase